MKKLFSITLILLMITSYNMQLDTKAQCTNQCELNIQVDIPGPTPPTPGGGGGGGGGAAIAIPAGAAALGGLGAFAPLLLAGLDPGMIAAAAPINCVCKKCCFLQTALRNHFNTTSYSEALSKAQATGVKSFYVVNDRTLLNGTFDIQDIQLPAKFANAEKIAFEATIVSDPYAEINGKPELELRIFKDINDVKLQKRYTSQGFRKKYLMNKYEIPYSSSMKAYGQGVHKVNGVIETSKIKNSQEPFKTVLSYMDGGFSKKMATSNPKAITYAYLIEFTAVN